MDDDANDQHLCCLVQTAHVVDVKFGQRLQGPFGELVPLSIEHLCPIVRDFSPVAQESEFHAPGDTDAGGRPELLTTERTEDEVSIVILIVAMRFRRRKKMLS